MKSSEFIEKAEHIVMVYGPLPISKIARIANYKGERPGRILGKSKNLFYTGNGRNGVWYLEHQVLGARDEYEKLLRLVETRIEEREHEVAYIPPNTEIHSFLSLFPTDKDVYTARQAWVIVGGHIVDVRNHLVSLERSGLLISKGKRPKVFRRNPACADTFETAEKIITDSFNENNL